MKINFDVGEVSVVGKKGILRQPTTKYEMHYVARGIRLPRFVIKCIILKDLLKAYKKLK